MAIKTRKIDKIERYSSIDGVSIAWEISRVATAAVVKDSSVPVIHRNARRMREMPGKSANFPIPLANQYLPLQAYPATIANPIHEKKSLPETNSRRSR